MIEVLTGATCRASWISGRWSRAIRCWRATRCSTPDRSFWWSRRKARRRHAQAPGRTHRLYAAAGGFNGGGGAGAASFCPEPHIHQRGDVEAALASAPHRIQGQFHIGGQEHFYLETQIALVAPGEDRTFQVWSSTQNPTEVQKLVASVLGTGMHNVTIDMRRMGGGFGGKETRAAGVACLCALAAHKTGRPAKMRPARRDDMRITGKRHPFFVRYDVGFDDEGRFCGVNIELAGNCGCSLDLSGSIVDRAMFHADNAYYLGDARVTGYRCRTNGLQHRLSRLRRAAGYGGDRADHRRGRAPSRTGPANGAQTQLLWLRDAQRHPLSSAG